MKSRSLVRTLLVVMALSLATAANAQEIRHVLLISVDGLHALDASRYIAGHPDSALAHLSRHGVTYTNARTPANSDSFPGLLALVTGGSPVSHGLFYDVSYDRTYFVNGDTNCATALTIADPTYGLDVGASAGPGSTIAFDETIDLYGIDPRTGLPLSLDRINPASLPYHIDASGRCVPVYPHDALKTNTVFEVIKAHGGRTAWADKHPAYDLVNGPSGHGVDDLYTPEITNVGGLDNTVSVVCTHENDHLKTVGIINQIHGLTHDGHPAHGVPTIFGANFQAVSVGQKLAHDNADPACLIDAQTAADAAALSGHGGGYVDGSGTPGEVLAYALDKVDADLRQIVAALKSRNLYDQTLVIITAKHGQSPVNPAKVNKPGHFADLVAGLGSVPGVNLSAEDLAAQSAIVGSGGCASGPCGFVSDDDVALIWLADPSATTTVAAFINKYATQLFVDEVMAGDELTLRFNDPRHDSRTPDIIVQPVYGTIYTTSKKKNAEHGGFSYGDTNVGLIVSHPVLDGRTIKTPVVTSQVAPTILRVLGIDPQELHSVREEHTGVLPGLVQ